MAKLGEQTKKGKDSGPQRTASSPGRTVPGSPFEDKDAEINKNSSATLVGTEGVEPMGMCLGRLCTEATTTEKVGNNRSSMDTERPFANRWFLIFDF